MPDIDIDFVDRDEALKLFNHTAASRYENAKIVKHNTGIYMHEVPVDMKTGTCSVDYETAEEQGFFKIDFLNVGIYKGIRNEEHLTQLMNTEPLWDLLEQEDFVNLLFHVNGHWNILKQMKPNTIEQLAAVLAIIRPAKRNLIGKSWDEIMADVWKKPQGSEYFFKKSHATAYAVAIVVQMNLICESISYGYN